MFRPCSRDLLPFTQESPGEMWSSNFFTPEHRVIPPGVKSPRWRHPSLRGSIPGPVLALRPPLFPRDSRPKGNFCESGPWPIQNYLLTPGQLYPRVAIAGMEFLFPPLSPVAPDDTSVTVFQLRQFRPRLS